MAWIFLVVAGVLEIVWAIGLKYADGFTRLWPSVFTIITMIASFFCLAQAVRTIPIGTAYAIWTGIGAVGAFALGIVLFKDEISLVRVLCVGLIVAGIVGLKLAAQKADAEPRAASAEDEVELRAFTQKPQPHG